MEEAKKQLETAVAESKMSEYNKGNILYLAENYADIKTKSALDAVAEYEANQLKASNKEEEK